jgi:hypothetical protein
MPRALTAIARTFGALLCLTGCYSHRPLTGPAPRGQLLLVKYARSTEVQFILRNDTSKVPVRELRGRALSVAGDTIRMLVTRGSDAEWHEVVGGSVAIISPGKGARVEQVRFDGAKTGMLVLGLVIVPPTVAILCVMAGVCSFYYT